MLKVSWITRRRPVKRTGAGGWWRKDHDFAKFKSMGDGEVTSLLIGNLSKGDLDRVYLETKELIERRNSSFQFMALSYAFAMIAFFGFSSSIEISGISIDVRIAPHVAMVVLSYASWSFSNINSKIGYSMTFFEYLYFRGSSMERAKFLLDYPQVISPFLFRRTIRGFPRFIHLKRNHWWEIIALAGFIVAVIVGSIIAISINVYGLWLIWRSGFPTPIISKIFVGLMIASGLFVWANPNFSNLKRRYVHYGMSQTIEKLTEDRQSAYHRLIAILRIEREKKNT